MAGYRGRLVGLEPGIVMNNPASMQSESGRTSIPSPAEEAEAKCYRLPSSKKFKQGELYIPAEFLMGALLNVSAAFKLKLGGKKETPKKWLAGAGLILPSRMGVGADTYEIYVTSAVVMTKRIMRARPRLFPWAVEFRLVFSNVDPLFVEVAHALQSVMSDMLTLAGVRAGMGDNRPSSPRKPGPHGRWLVETCEFDESLNG